MKRIPPSSGLVLGALASLCVLIPAISGGQPRRDVIADTMPAVAMILAVDVQDGKLVPVSSGSGTIIDSNGSVITNHHVLFDGENNRLHDLFIIGLYKAANREPDFVCAGVPAKGILKPDVDLALIRCDRDRAGAPFTPSSWPTIPIRQLDKGDIVPGEQVWVLGYPGVGNSTIHVTAGLVSGWTGEDGGAGSRAFMKTDASITRGNSGGTAIDENGNFIGVPSAFRLTTTTHGAAVVAAGRVGLIRPLEHALDLVAQARRGGPLSSEASPSAKDPGVLVSGKVVNTTTGGPIGGAFAVVFKQGLTADDLDENRLDEQALSWGYTDPAGVFSLNKGIPRGGTYTVAVRAPGFLPLVETAALTISGTAPSKIDPWKRIGLQPE